MLAMGGDEGVELRSMFFLKLAMSCCFWGFFFAHQTRGTDRSRLAFGVSDARAPAALQRPPGLRPGPGRLYGRVLSELRDAIVCHGVHCCRHGRRRSCSPDYEAPLGVSWWEERA